MESHGNPPSWSHFYIIFWVEDLKVTNGPWNHVWMSPLRVLVGRVQSNTKKQDNNKQWWETWACSLTSIIKQSRIFFQCAAACSLAIIQEEEASSWPIAPTGRPFQNFISTMSRTKINILRPMFSCFLASTGCFPPNVHSTINIVSAESRIPTWDKLEKLFLISFCNTDSSERTNHPSNLFLVTFSCSVEPICRLHFGNQNCT